MVDVPTTDDIITRFPSLEGKEDLIDAILPEASAKVTDSWRVQDQKIAIMYLVAHMVTVEGDADSLPVISESLGPFSTSYAYSTDDNPYFRTEYGRRWWGYAQANGAGGGGGILLVGGGR